MATSLVGNVIDYGFGRNRDKGILSQEFAVSTGVDTVMAVGTGLVAAATVAGVAALFSVTLPVSGAIIAAAALGTVIGIGLDSAGVGDAIKEKANETVDAIEQGVDQLVEGTVRVVQEISSSVSNTVNNVLNNVTGFLGNVFGNG